MCGIVGYIGDKQAEPILIEGLKHLEYRGYDSAGLAFLKSGKFSLVRARGKLTELVGKIGGNHHDATVGIGHTRWATHGRPDEINAHPHHSRDVVLVHNGIIENYRPLKERLLKNGHKIVSETDTEVICHLIQDHLNHGIGFFDAIKQAISELKGAFSLVILDRNDSQRIYTVRRGSPLVVGHKEGECFVASDIPALLPHTREVAFLHDDEMAVLTRDGIRFYSFSGEPIAKKFKHIAWTTAQAEKSGYKHFMIKEIHEQPRVLADTLGGRVNLQTLRIDLGEETHAVLKKFVNGRAPHLHIVACGTSWHAAYVGKYWIENLSRVPVSVDLSSEFRYRQPLVGKDSLVLAISQSGETADTLAAVRESRKLGAQVLSICNVVESSIPRESNATVYTHAGPEIGVASTKAFTTQLAVLYMTAIKMAFFRDLISDSEAQGRMQALLEMPGIAKKFLATISGLDEMVEKIYQKEHCYFIGRGIQFPIVMEGALKLKEISYVHAEAFAGGEMKHGPIALIEENSPVVAVALGDALYEKMVSNIMELKARGANVMALTSEDDRDLRDQLKYVITVPQTHPDLYPFLTVIPLQLLAYHVADRKGTDVDQPRNLAKSVTVE